MVSARRRFNRQFQPPRARPRLRIVRPPMRSLVPSIRLRGLPMRSFVPKVRLMGIRALVRASEDRRRFHPAGKLAAAGGTSIGARRMVISKPRVASVLRSGRRLRAAVASRPNYLPNRVSFAIPTKVAVCVRRHQRREVLHAMGRAGGGRKRPPRFTEFSDISCR